MNFFDAQDKAKRTTRWLVGMYALFALLIVAGVTLIVAGAIYQTGQSVDPVILLATASVSAALIVGATLYKTAVLSAGGGRVARDMGGTPIAADTQDPLRQRLRNVVEEMAIASGVPVPEIFVLEQESGINAFAAGFTTGDAAIAVTRGTLEILNREELQGVIAHEFSHILNGDMRLNIRLMGVLFGIMVIGLIGRMILRGSSRHRMFSSRDNRNGGGLIAVGAALTALGWIGVVGARMIKSAVSRQREFLADSSAVQFTRQTDGIANALKKIGGYSRHSYIEATDPEEVSHMLFAGGMQKFASLFATHPPLRERIEALDPSFSESDFPDVEGPATAGPGNSEQVAGFAGDSVALPDSGDSIVSGNIVDSIGQPTPEQVAFARQLRESIPESLNDAAHSSEGAFLLTVALVMDPSHAERQITIVAGQLGEDRTAILQRYFDELQNVGAIYRLPLLEIAFPALKQRPAPNLEFLLDLVRRLIETDGEIDLREYCYYRMISRHLRQAIAPSADKRHNRVSKSDARNAAIDLVRIVAHHGHDEPGERDAAFAAGLSVFGDWVKSGSLPDGHANSVEELDRALDVLEKMNFAGRRSMIEAVTAAVGHDGRLTITEAELLRAVCASLECPLPPIISKA